MVDYFYTITQKPGERKSTFQAKKRFLKVYGKTMRNISRACEAADINRDTFYSWYTTDAEFCRAIDAIKEQERDYIEDKLMSLIEMEHVASIFFYLSHRHPKYMPERQIGYRGPTEDEKEFDSWLNDQYETSNEAK